MRRKRYCCTYCGGEGEKRLNPEEQSGCVGNKESSTISYRRCDYVTHSHFTYLRMSKERFDSFLEQISPMLVHRHYESLVRDGISPAERLDLTLSFLATGNFKILKDTCEAIWNVLMPQYVMVPASTAEWEGVSRQFDKIWNLQHCIDDCAIFNYRLSRARRVIENTFGILAARWHLFRRPIIANPKRVILYVQASVALHNFLRTTQSSVYCPPGFIDVEDGSGNPIDGRLRQDDEANTGL